LLIILQSNKINKSDDETAGEILKMCSSLNQHNQVKFVQTLDILCVKLQARKTMRKAKHAEFSFFDFFKHFSTNSNSTFTYTTFPPFPSNWISTDTRASICQYFQIHTSHFWQVCESMVFPYLVISWKISSKQICFYADSLRQKIWKIFFFV